MIPSWTNSNHGIVTKLLDGGNKVEVRLPRGGHLTCRNRGFEVGDEVCFSLDPSGTLITSITYKAIADMKVALAQDPYTRLETEDPDANLEEDIFSDGQEIEGLLDLCCGESGNGPSEWEDNINDPIGDEDGYWDDYYGGIDADSSGETSNNEVHLLDEWDAVFGLATDNPHTD